MRYIHEAPLAPFKVESSFGQNYLVKFTDAKTNVKVLTVFIRGGVPTEIDVPLGNYIMKYAVGEKWFGYTQLFSPKTIYVKADETLRFWRDGNVLKGHTVTLYPVLGGNLRTEAINAEDF